MFQIKALSTTALFLALMPLLPALTSTQEAKLLASDGAAYDGFGLPVAIDGDTVAVSAIDDDGSTGAVYVFVRNGLGWTQQQKLFGQAADDDFGDGLALEGDTLVIGATKNDANGTNKGAAYVYTRTGTTWSLQDTLLASDPGSSGLFGRAASISGDRVVIGASMGFAVGAAYVFKRTGTDWAEEDKLVASDGVSNDDFGAAVSIDGDTVVVAARFDDDAGSDSGSCYVFTRSGSDWTERAKLNGSGSGGGDYFGHSVAIDGNTILVGAVFDDSVGLTTAGAAYIFTGSGASWSEQAKLTRAQAQVDDRFGVSVDLEGDTAVVGAYLATGMTSNSGAANLFVRSGSTWTEELTLFAADGQNSDWFGWAVGVSDERAIVGSYRDTNVRGTNAGSAYIFRTGERWTDLGNGLAGTYGIPMLIGEGDLVTGEEILISLTGAKENALAALIIGSSAANLPFKGGTMVPAFEMLNLLTTDPSGNLLIETTVGTGPASGTTLYFQYWIQDAAAYAGYSASNAVSRQAP